MNIMLNLSRMQKNTRNKKTNTQVEKKHQKKPKEILPLWIDILSRLNKKITITTQKDKEAILEKLKPKEDGK